MLLKPCSASFKSSVGPTDVTYVCVGGCVIFLGFINVKFGSWLQCLSSAPPGPLLSSVQRGLMCIDEYFVGQYFR